MTDCQANQELFNILLHFKFAFYIDANDEENTP